MPEYKGRCDHEMVHKILTDHYDNLKEHEIEALEKLRQGIHKIVQGITNIKVTIYVGKLEPIKIINGNGDNELVLTIEKDGTVVFDWVQKTPWQKAKELGQDMAAYVLDVATQLVKTIVQSLISTLALKGKEAIESGGQKAIKWVTEKAK